MDASSATLRAPLVGLAPNLKISSNNLVLNTPCEKSEMALSTNQPRISGQRREI